MTSCSGCISTLFSLDIFPQFLEKTKIAYFPYITDEEKLESYDMALIEGCIIQESQIQLIQEIRRVAKKIYLLGSCAAFGGMINLSEKKRGDPISNYIEVDGIIPGCPPPSNLFGNCLMDLLENKMIKLSNRNQCYSCPLRESLDYEFKTKITKLIPNNRDINSAQNPKCFLSQGVLCLGPVTREGCENKCIIKGMPCESCLGPPSKSSCSNIYNFLSLLDISIELKTYEGIFFRYSKPIIKR
jgi:F420-non-reducing hydrogenase small subunit